MTSPVKSASILWVAIVLVCGPALAQSEAPACALHEPDAPHLRGLGTVIGIQDPAKANSDIRLRQGAPGRRHSIRTISMISAPWCVAG